MFDEGQANKGGGNDLCFEGQTRVPKEKVGKHTKKVGKQTTDTRIASPGVVRLLAFLDRPEVSDVPVQTFKACKLPPIDRIRMPTSHKLD